VIFAKIASREVIFVGWLGAEGAVEGALGVLVADGLAGRAEGFLVEMVTVGVELTFGEVFVVGDLVVGGEMSFDIIPGVSLVF